MNNYIKENYIKINPNDETLPFIKSDVTFGDVYQALLKKDNIQDIMGSNSDSLRKYVFYELSSKLDKSYDDIYNLYQYRNDLTSPNKNKSLSDNAYLLDVHVIAVLPVELPSDNEAEWPDILKSRLEEADYGALVNVNTGINEKNQKTISESLKDIIESSSMCEAGTNQSVINVLIDGDFVVSMNAIENETEESVLRYAQRHFELFYAQLEENIGDLKSPTIAQITSYRDNMLKGRQFQKESIDR